MSLPRGWAEATIGEFAQINPKHPPDTDRNQVVSFVPMPAVDEHLGVIVESSERILNEVWTGYTHFADGDVIFAKITPCMENGKAAVANGLKNGLGCGSTEFFVLRPEDENNPVLIWRYLRQLGFRAEAETQMTGAVGQQRVPRGFLEDHAFVLPPAAEQRRIVAKLDALTVRIARARAELDRVPGLVAQIRADTAARLWSASPDATLDDFLGAPIRNGLSVKGSDQPPGIRALRLSALRGAFVNLEDVRFLPIAFDRAEPFCLTSDDILVSRGNGTLSLVGRASVVETTPIETTIFPDTAFRLRVDPKKASARWVSLVWNSAQVRSQVEDMARTTAGIWKISQRDLRAVRLPRLNLADQVRAAEEVQAAFARADRLESEAARARALLDRLESAILAKAFRGELVPQDPNDEPASVLLERIRENRAAAPKAKRGRKATV